VPALIISPYAKKGFVDHTQYDTTSILKFIENRWGLAPLTSLDAAVNDLSNAFNFSQQPAGQGGQTPSQLPNTSGETQPPAAILAGLALLIGLGGLLLRRKARVM
jgi:phospholipase C